VSRFFQRLVFVLAIVVFGSLGMGFAMGEFGLFGVYADSDQDGAYRQMNVYAEVLKKIQTDYVTEPNIDDVTTGALHGLLESLDSDSSYLTPTEYKIYKERPTSGVAQVGINVSKRFGYATVVSVLPGSAADKVHLSDGDVIESIGGQSTRELSLAVIRLMLEGKPGSTIALSVVRPLKADPEKLTLTRALPVTLPLSEQEYNNSTILYLKPGVLTARPARRLRRRRPAGIAAGQLLHQAGNPGQARRAEVSRPDFHRRSGQDLDRCAPGRAHQPWHLRPG
jgi:carboxyl-terminal processing protease